MPKPRSWLSLVLNGIEVLFPSNSAINLFQKKENENENEKAGREPKDTYYSQTQPCTALCINSSATET